MELRSVDAKGYMTHKLQFSLCFSEVLGWTAYLSLVAISPRNVLFLLFIMSSSLGLEE
jgi:hypothetical protein